MNLSLSFALSSRLFGSGVDPDAQAYINAVTSAKGSSPSLLQTVAIDNFYKAEKAAGRYSKHKMMYLPIWANAAANAIDLISLTSGTFVGDVTHGSGYIQGDGTTGYFRTGKIASTLGLDLATNYGSASVLVNLADSRNQNAEWLGATDGANRRLLLGQATNNFTSGNAYSAAAGASLGDALKRGIYTVSVESSSLRRWRRYSNGNVLAGSASNSTLNTTTAPTVEQYLLARNNNNAGATLHTDARLGFAHMGFVMTETELNDFANNVETLWETCTGLTLP